MAYVIDAKIIECLSNHQLLCRVEVGRGHLLAFAQGAVDDAEAGEIDRVGHGGDAAAVGASVGVVHVVVRSARHGRASRRGFGRDVVVIVGDGVRQGGFHDATDVASGTVSRGVRHGSFHGMACLVSNGGAASAITAAVAAACTIAHGVACMMSD